MEKLILGMLMLRKLTVYEIRATIKMSFTAMCSDSLGSIQAAIKRLLDADMVTYTECVEKSVNKKRYAITDKGRGELIQWLGTPANIAGAKNMELGKFLFMGMLPADDRAAMMDGIIDILEKDLEKLLALQSINNDENKAALLEHQQTDMKYYGFVAEKTKDINDYMSLTLQYGVDLTKFNLEWFSQLKKQNNN